MKKKFLTALFAAAFVICGAFGLSACSGGEGGNGGNGGGNSPTIGTTFSPVITYDVESATVNAQAGTPLSNCNVTLRIRYELYTGYVDLEKGAVYSADVDSVNVSLSGSAKGTYEVADENFEQTAREAVNHKDWGNFLNTSNTLTTMLSNYKDAFEAANPGTSAWHGSMETVVKDSMSFGSAIYSKLQVKLTSNENNPVKLKIATSKGRPDEGITPYVRYRYTDLTAYVNAPDDHLNFTFTKDDFAFLGDMADDQGFCVKLNKIDFTKVYKGVYYRVQEDLSSTFFPNARFRTKVYYGTALTDTVHFKDDTITCSADNDEIVFDVNDVSNLVYNNKSEINLQLKLYTNSDYDKTDGTVNLTVEDNSLSPQSMQVTIPDMEVVEVKEKSEQIKVTLKYSDGFTLELDSTQYVKSVLKAIVPPDDVLEGFENLPEAMPLIQQLEYMRSSKQPKQMQCLIQGSDSFSPELSTIARFTLTQSLAYAKFDDKSKIADSYYEFEEFEIPEDLKIINYYYDNYFEYSSGDPASVIVETQADSKLFAALKKNIDEGVIGKVNISLANDKMCSPGMCDALEITVKQDTVECLEVKLSLFFGGIIVGEEIDVTDCFIEVTMTHGHRKTLPLTLGMIGEYEETTGMQDVEITYKEASATVQMPVRKIKSISVAEGLDKYYLLNDTPAPEVWLKATFTDNEYDYLLCPSDRIDKLDLTTTGTKSITIAYGGAQTSFSYTVIEGAHITYTEKDGSITLNKFNIGLPAEGTLAFIPEDVKNIVIPEEIEGVPVTALSANLFKGQSILRSLVVPDSITTISYGIVDGCNNLEKLTISGSIPLSKFFAQYKKGSVTSSAVYPDISEKLEVIISGETLCDNFFADLYLNEKNKTIAKFTLGNKITQFGEQSTSDLKYISQFTDGGSEKVFAKDNVIFTDEGATLAYYSAFKQDTKYTIPEGVKTANIQSDYIAELTIPAHVQTLGEYFMDNAKELTKVIIADGSAITALPDGAFSGCEKLSVFNFPENLVTLGTHALSYTAIEKIILPATVTTVGSSAFYFATCTHFYIPAGATQSFIYNQYGGGSYLTLPNLQKLAYDGSVQLTKLTMFADSFTRQSVELYITGENTSVYNEWYSSNVINKISKVYVCREAANFSPNYFDSSKVVWEKNGATVDRWWKD